LVLIGVNELMIEGDGIAIGPQDATGVVVVEVPKGVTMNPTKNTMEKI